MTAAVTALAQQVLALVPGCQVRGRRARLLQLQGTLNAVSGAQLLLMQQRRRLWV